MRVVKALMLIAAVCAALVLAACGSDDDTGNEGANGAAGAPATEGAPAPEGAADVDLDAKPEVEVPGGEAPDRLQVDDLVEGDGAEAKSGDEVTVQYVGVGHESGEEFDASWDRGEPFTFELGAGMVIPGWDQGVEGMKEGGRRQLVIPPDLAYGEAGAPPAIGPSETLVFVVDLVEVG